MANPLTDPWTGPYGLPDFATIADAHFMPAFDAALTAHEAEIAAIIAEPGPASFENTIAAMERSGELLGRVASVFFHRAGTDSTSGLQEIERAITPRLASHRAAMLMNPHLFARVEAVSSDGLSAEEARVLELYLAMFERAGARLDDAGRTRMAEIMSRLAALGTQFAQNVLADESDWAMIVDADDLAGCPDGLIAAAAAEAERRGAPGRYAITLARSSVEPFLTFGTRRDLRRQAYEAWAARGEATNWPVVAETLALRAERAALLGYPSFAAYKLDDQMAGTPERVADMLHAAWKPAVARAAEERDALSALAREDGLNGPIFGWDWRFYAERARKAAHDLDEAEIKPYLALDNVIAAAFDVSARLFGLAFEPLDVPVPNPEARAWGVTRSGAPVGVFVADYFARPGKRSGAWMNAFRGQQKLRDPGRPVIFNTMNFAKGDPALLSWDDARTLFHEFGHALHGLLSDVTYPKVSGTSVSRDFVELPSQLFEHWLADPDVLATFAVHVETGAPMPSTLVEKIRAAENFGQGFRTVEFVASALVDLEMHRADPAGRDPAAWEAEILRDLAMPDAIGMRHRTPHFQHVFTGDGYSSGYYSYMWAEMMEWDAYHAFEEAGDPFDKATADRLLSSVLSVGGSVPPEAAYQAFRGRMPGVEALLAGRGLIADPAG